MKYLLLVIMLVVSTGAAFGQELYIFTEPASNMPAKSVAIQLAAKFPATGTFRQRYTPEVMLGISKKWMVHVGGTFSDYNTQSMKAESVRLYTKYRFLNHDDIHRHFRMATFGDLSFSNAPYIYDDASLEGGNSGLQAGIIASQLLNKLAVSGTMAYSRMFVPNAGKVINNDPSYHYAIYSLSAGYLIFPRQYKSYRQPNVNMYIELLGARSLDKKYYGMDAAPGLQLILNSSIKINAGYRFQLTGNMHRMANSLYQLAFEYNFFNVIK